MISAATYKKLVDRAEARIRPYVRATPLEPAGEGSYLKLECLQHTRSFKLRGALNKLLSLSEVDDTRGIITASTGNHGLAVAYGLQLLNRPGTIVLPETAARKKVALLERYDVTLQFYGQDSAEAERFARTRAEREGLVFISPYNDEQVVAGQGTIGVELMTQLPSIKRVFVPVGGGGLIGGIAAYLKAVKPSVEIYGCLPANSPVMHECVEAGEIVAGKVLPTLSDGTAGGVEEDAITFDLCRDFVDEWIRVSEDEIREGMKVVFERYGLVVEGAAGVSMAAYHKIETDGDDVIVLCGGNVDIEQFKSIVM